MKLHLALTTLVVLLLAGCGPTVHWRQQRTAPPFSDACCPRLIEKDGVLPADAELLADIELGDTGFSTRCTRESNLELVRQRACRVGADLVRVVSVSGNFWTTCDLVHAELYRLSERPQPANAKGSTISDGTALCADRFSLRPRTKQGSAPLVAPGDAASRENPRSLSSEAQ